MEIKDRIKRISQYFKEMKIINIDGAQVIYINVKFPQGWTIDENIEEKFSTVVQNGNELNEYYFFTEIENEEKIFEAIEYNIEKMKDAIERATLLKQKVNELKDIFQDEKITIDNLRNLKFSWEKNDIMAVLMDNSDIKIDNINMVNCDEINNSFHKEDEQISQNENFTKNEETVKNNKKK